jgi:hypothetical protein
MNVRGGGLVSTKCSKATAATPPATTFTSFSLVRLNSNGKVTIRVVLTMFTLKKFPLSSILTVLFNRKVRIQRAHYGATAAKQLRTQSFAKPTKTILDPSNDL